MLVLAYDTEPILLAECKHEPDEVKVRNAGAELAVDLIHRGAPQGETVDLVNRSMQLGEIEKRTRHLLDMSLETFVGTESRPGWAA